MAVAVPTRRRDDARGGAAGPRYPARLALPGLAWYVLFFLCPLAIMALFSVSERVGFSSVEYDLNLSSTPADRR